MIRQALLSNRDLHLLKLPTGAGKTYICCFYCKWLKLTCSEFAFIFLCPEYEHGVEPLAKMLSYMRVKENVDFIKLVGRNKCCKAKSIVINKNGNTVGDFFENNLSIKEFCENKCPIREKCECIRKIRILLAEDSGIKSWIGVHDQIEYFLPIYLMHNSGLKIVVFIDEDVERITEKKTGKDGISLSLINTHIDFLRRITEKVKEKKTKKGKKTKLTPADNKYLDYIFHLNGIFKEFRKSLVSAKRLFDYKDLELQFTNFLIDESMIKDSTYYLDKLKNDLTENIKNNYYHIFPQQFDLIHKLVKIFGLETLADYEYEINWLKNTILIKEKYKEKGNFFVDILFYDNLSLINMFNSKSIHKIIHNNATGNREDLETTYGNAVGEIIEHNNPNVFKTIYKDITIIQLNKWDNIRKRYSQYVKTSLQNESTLNHQLNNIKSVYNGIGVGFKPILVVSREIDSKYYYTTISSKFKPFFKPRGLKLSQLIKEIGKDIRWNDYPLTGTNIYKDCRCIVILGRPNLPYNPKLKIQEGSRRAFLLNRTEKQYSESYSRKSILQAIGRITRFEEGIKKMVILLTGFEVFTERFLKENKINIISLKGHSKFQTHFKRKSTLTILRTYLLKHRTITIKQAEILFELPRSKTYRLMDIFEENNIVKYKRKSNKEGGKHFYLVE